MKIVRIADLSEEERKKALQKQEERFQKNEEERQIEIKRVNKLVEEQKIQEKIYDYNFCFYSYCNDLRLSCNKKQRLFRWCDLQ